MQSWSYSKVDSNWFRNCMSIIKGMKEVWKQIQVKLNTLEINIDGSTMDRLNFYIKSNTNAENL